VPDKPIDERREDKNRRDENLIEEVLTNIKDRYNEKLEEMYGPKKTEDKKEE